jgi:putative acyl-CoA dehydrogenase
MALIDSFDASPDTPVRAEARALRELLALGQGEPEALESQARRFTQGLVLCAQALLMREQAEPAVADAFVASRLAGGHGRVYGTAPLRVEGLLERALA